MTNEHKLVNRFFILKRLVQSLLLFLLVTSLLYTIYYFDFLHTMVGADFIGIPDYFIRSTLMDQYLATLKLAIQNHILIFCVNLPLYHVSAILSDFLPQAFKIDPQYFEFYFDVYFNTLNLVFAVFVVAIILFLVLKKVRRFERITSLQLGLLTLIYPTIITIISRLVLLNPVCTNIYDRLFFKTYGIQQDISYPTIFALKLGNLELDIKGTSWFMDRISHLILPMFALLPVIMPLLFVYLTANKFTLDKPDVTDSPSQRGISINWNSFQVKIPMLLIIFLNVFCLFHVLHYVELFFKWPGLMTSFQTNISDQNKYVYVRNNLIIWSLIITITFFLDILHAYLCQISKNQS